MVRKKSSNETFRHIFGVKLDLETKQRVPLCIIDLDKSRLMPGQTLNLKIDDQQSRFNVGQELQVELSQVWKAFGSIAFRGVVRSGASQLNGHGRWDPKRQTGVWFM